MLTISDSGGDALRVGGTGTEDLIALVLSDEDLLRAEFDAIVAAEWPSPPSVGTGVAVAVEHPVPAAGHREFTSAVRVTTSPRHPGIDGWARQRSPPAGLLRTASQNPALRIRCRRQMPTFCRRIAAKQIRGWCETSL